MPEVSEQTDLIKVRALRTGYYYNRRMYGDDTLGEGNGDVFTLEGRDITEYDSHAGKPIRNKETGQVQTRYLTAEEQFSPLWMERVDDDTPLKMTTSQQIVNHQNGKLAESKRPKRSRAS